MAGKHVGSDIFAQGNLGPPAFPGSRVNRAFAEGYARAGTANPHVVGTPEWNAFESGRAHNVAPLPGQNGATYTRNQRLQRECAPRPDTDFFAGVDFTEWNVVGADITVTPRQVTFPADDSQYIWTTLPFTPSASAVYLGACNIGFGLGDYVFGDDPATAGSWFGASFGAAEDTLFSITADTDNLFAVRGRVGTPVLDAANLALRAAEPEDELYMDPAFMSPPFNATEAEGRSGTGRAAWDVSSFDNTVAVPGFEPYFSSRSGPNGGNELVFPEWPTPPADFHQLCLQGRPISLGAGTYRVSWQSMTFTGDKTFRVKFCDTQPAAGKVGPGDNNFVDITLTAPQLTSNMDFQCALDTGGVLGETRIEGPITVEKIA